MANEKKRSAFQSFYLTKPSRKKCTMAYCLCSQISLLLEFLEKCQRDVPKAHVVGVVGLSPLPEGLGVPAWEMPPLG